MPILHSAEKYLKNLQTVLVDYLNIFQSLALCRAFLLPETLQSFTRVIKEYDCIIKLRC